jgi:5-formyltetrahydrofolate cyclo-ligase
VYRQAQLIFITPDNCLEDLRWQALKDGKRVLVTSYAIKRGFYLLDPAVIDPADYRYVATLDGMERLGQPVPLLLIPSLGKLDLLVTGASAISLSGVRFGKGHGFFDLEWAMLYEVGAVSLDTPVIGFGHDCQLVDIQLEATPFDTVCDYIVTNSQALRVENAPKPTVGVQWEKLQPDMLETIPPLQELRAKVS